MSAKVSFVAGAAITAAVAGLAIQDISKTSTEQDNKMLFHNVHVTRVYDGDTFYVNFPELPPLFGDELGVRILGIDTAEMKGTSGCIHQDAQEAKDALTNLLSGKEVSLIDCSRDKYFRALCTVSVANSIDVKEYMLTHKLAVPYNGDTKKPWTCKS